MPFFRMQARASDTSLMYYWTASSKDYAGAGYPGTGTPEDVAVTSLQPEGTNMTSVTSFAGRSGIVVPQTSDYTAAQVNYDNATSGLTATDAQAAIDEVNAKVDVATPYFLAYYTPEVAGAQYDQYTWTTSTEEGGMTSSLNHTVEVPEDGLYRVEVCLRATNASTSNPHTITSEVRTSSGGTVAVIRELRYSATTTEACMGAVVITLRLSDGDTVWVRRGNGGSTASGAGSTSSFLCVTKIGE